MKKILSLCMIVLLLAPCVPTATAAPADASAEMRGVWVSSVLNLDYPSKQGLTTDALKQEALAILDNAKDIGLNTVFLQVRPAADALYKSEIFPWSAYLTGEQGKAPADGFDPLAFWIEEAHKRGLALHAWLNPFRAAVGSAQKPVKDASGLAAGHPARQNPGWAVPYKDGNLYLDPGIPAVRALVVSGVSEILRNYDVDGIHYDDYFYPESDFPDDASFASYGQGNRSDWRRDNINALIKDTQTAVRMIKPNARFGVSPFGIWCNTASSAFGSDTNGLESYRSHYADSRRWVKEGWLDYICPQLYWHMGFDKADYEKLLSWWLNVCAGTGVDLYIGQAGYRAGTGTSQGDPWYGTEEIIRQLQKNSLYDTIKGSVFFRYGSFQDYSGALGQAVKTYYAQKGQAYDPSIPVVLPVPQLNKLSVGRPSSDITTSAQAYYVLGTSDPAQKLLLNGKEVTGRTAEGFFAVQVTLQNGANKLAFTQPGGAAVTRTITRASASVSSPKTLDKAEIQAGSTYPHVYDEYWKPGETMTLKCTAPVGAEVTVRLAGSTYKLKPASTQKPDSQKIYATTFSCEYTLPQYSTTGKVIMVGTPEYTMKWNGVTSTRRATGDIKCITPGAPYYAKITAASAWAYPGSTTTGGPAGELTAGQQDAITAVAKGGDWVRLSTGLWVQRVNLTRTLYDTPQTLAVTDPVYTVGAKWDTLTWKAVNAPAAKLSYNGQTLTVTLPSGGAAAPALPPGALFESASVSTQGGFTALVLTLPKGKRLEGYDMQAGTGTFTLNLKRTPALAGGDKPLSGISVCLDAGHGGQDYGAIGPLGSALSEKTLNLYLTQKVRAALVSRGASVTLTRDTDIYLTLEDRVARSRQVKPDLFLSLHVNSMDESTDASSIRGISTWYKEQTAKAAAESMYDYLWNQLGIPKRGAHQANLYVCRPQWAPSFIIETGFICNVQDYAWLIQDAKQNELANAIADGVVAYFSAGA